MSLTSNSDNRSAVAGQVIVPKPTYAVGSGAADIVTAELVRGQYFIERITDCMPTYDFFDHPRFRHLCQLLHDVAAPETIMGHICRIESFMAGSSLPRLTGDLSDMEDKGIEHAANWFSHPGRFVDAMRESELLYETETGQLQFRGWPNYAPKFVKKKISGALGAEKRWSDMANDGNRIANDSNEMGANSKPQQQEDAGKQTIQSRERERVEILNSPPTPPAGGDAADAAGGGMDPPDQIERSLRRAGLRSGSKIRRMIEQSPWLTPDGIDRVARAVKSGGGRAGLIAETLADEEAYQAAQNASGGDESAEAYREHAERRRVAQNAEKQKLADRLEQEKRAFRELWEGVPESERDRILAVAGEQYERGECIVRGEPLRPRTVRQMPFSVRGSPDEWTNIAKWIVESVIKTTLGERCGNE